MTGPSATRGSPRPRARSGRGGSCSTARPSSSASMACPTSTPCTHSGKHDEEVQLCAFDILVEGDDDLRKLPLHLRKTNLARLLARRPDGIFVAPFEQGEIGPDLF